MSPDHVSANVTTDDSIRQAVARFVTRSERASDPETLVSTFVDSGIVGLVDVPRNQVIYGRRGTGKTHVLGVLESTASQTPKTVTSYIDVRTLGSSTMFTDYERHKHDRFIGLYRDILSLLVNALLEYCIESPSNEADSALADLDSIEQVLTHTELTTTSVERRRKTADDRTTSASLGGTVGASGLSISAGLEHAGSVSASAEDVSQFAATDKIVFPGVYDGFKRALDHLDLDGFLILIDEWSSIPNDLQPYLAELLNRVFFANPKVTIKIASLEFRSFFLSTDGEGRREFGLELGGDVESVDLDDFYVYDRDPTGTEAIFADVLYRHVVAGLPADYLATQFGISSAREFVRAFFTDVAFKELVRASEGVARDLLQIFARAFTHAWRNGAAHVTGPSVTTAARDWYESDKQANLSEEQQALLRALTEQVIGDRRARSFLVSRDDSNSPLLRSLIDQRVIHIIRKGYADKDRPGIRYNIYTLDYGCYVDLKGTKTEPMQEFLIPEEAEYSEDDEIIVPFDDNRSIRRIIVPRELLFPSRRETVGR